MKYLLFTKEENEKFPIIAKNKVHWIPIECIEGYYLPNNTDSLSVCNSNKISYTQVNFITPLPVPEIS